MKGEVDGAKRRVEGRVGREIIRRLSRRKVFDLIFDWLDQTNLVIGVKLKDGSKRAFSHIQGKTKRVRIA